MSFVENPVTSSTSRPVGVRLRSDVRFERQSYHGEISWVAKDPVALRYFRLREEEYAVLQMLDGKTTLDKIKNDIEREFAPLVVEHSELQSLIGSFHQFGLVLSNTEGQGEQLFKRRSEMIRRKWLGRLASLLWIKLPGIDPERFLAWGYPKVRWFFTRWCMTCCGILALSALLLVLIHIDEFYAKLPGFYQFFSMQNAFMMMIALAFAKILHEFGHGFSCKHFGGECHEIGVLFLVFTPCLFCDTSDSWMLRNKWHRAAIGAAGMYVEVVLASISTFVWWYTQPGMVHYLALNVMFISSVSTVIFNANPLLRYDGYYILADIWEVPNLAQKSRGALMGILQEQCLGMPWRNEWDLSPRRRYSFALYAMASVFYRWFIMIFILWFLSEVFEPYGLQVIGHFLIAMSLITLIVMPLWKTFKFFRVPGRIRQVKKVRLAITVATVCGVILAVALVPVPHHVMTTLVIQPRDAERVYVNVPGVLGKVDVKSDEAAGIDCVEIEESDEIDLEAGDYVNANQPLVKLTNLEIDLEIVNLKGERDRLEIHLKTLRLRQEDKEAESQIRQNEAALLSLKERLQRRLEDQDRLTLKAPIDGYILPPPETPAPSTTDLNLPVWSGTPLDKKNLGCWLETGTPFCLIGDPDRLEAVLVIDQSDIEFVRQDQTVQIKLDEYPTRTIRGKINEIAKIDLKVAPRELSNKSGGELSTETDKGGAERPMSASYQALVPIENFDRQLLSGYRGRARIHTGNRTLGQMLVRYLLETLRFR